ncbi:hypothetical protein EBT31_00080 [bacterium]|nr:hypothetical protein [bacterium]
MTSFLNQQPPPIQAPPPKPITNAWRDRLDIEADKDYIIALVPQMYPNPYNPSSKVPFYVFKQHQLSDGRQFRRYTCTGKGCLACAEAAAGNKCVGPAQDAVALSVLHLGFWATMPSRDSTGKAIIKEDGTAFYDWQRVETVEDQRKIISMIQSGSVDPSLNRPRTLKDIAPARYKYLELGSAIWQKFNATDQLVANNCVCGGELSVGAFVCPACQEPLADPTRMSLKEVQQFQDSRVKCKKCGVEDFPAIIQTCSADCPAPEPTSIWNSVLQVRRTTVPGKKRPTYEWAISAPRTTDKQVNTLGLRDNANKPIPLTRGYRTVDGIQLPNFTEPFAQLVRQFPFDRMLVTERKTLDMFTGGGDDNRGSGGRQEFTPNRSGGSRAPDFGNRFAPPPGELSMPPSDDDIPF